MFSRFKTSKFKNAKKYSKNIVEFLLVYWQLLNVVADELKFGTQVYINKLHLCVRFLADKLFFTKLPQFVEKIVFCFSLFS